MCTELGGVCRCYACWLCTSIWTDWVTDSPDKLVTKPQHGARRDDLRFGECWTVFFSFLPCHSSSFPSLILSTHLVISINLVNTHDYHRCFSEIRSSVNKRPLQYPIERPGQLGLNHRLRPVLVILSSGTPEGKMVSNIAEYAPCQTASRPW